jgi:hypothetical protein
LSKAQGIVLDTKKTFQDLDNLHNEVYENRELTAKACKINLNLQPTSRTIQHYLNALGLNLNKSELF